MLSFFLWYEQVNTMSYGPAPEITCQFKESAVSPCFCHWENMEVKDNIGLFRNEKEFF